jgi:hypothetical protein
MLVSASGVEDVIHECLHRRSLPFSFFPASVVGLIGLHTRYCISELCLRICSCVSGLKRLFQGPRKVVE